MTRAPLVVALGGSTRTGSTTELVLREILEAAQALGARTELHTGGALLLPPYQPGFLPPEALPIVDAFRRADALVLGSPGYHGSVSGLVKNAIDYSEELRDDERVYFDGLPVGCVATAFGWQGAVHTVGALRDIVHALRGWPTPLGLAVNTAEQVILDGSTTMAARIRAQAVVMAEQLVSFASRPALAPA